MKLKFLCAIATAFALAAAGCGDDDDGASAARAAGNGVDRAFVADMIPHHESAIEMAKLAQRRGESAFVKQLAADIVRSQAAEIATMRSEDRALAAAGVKAGSLGVPEHMKGMDHDPQALTTADAFDAAFIAMMIPHHQGALEMADAEIARGADPELKALAEAIIDAQRREIAAMRDHAADGGGGDTSHEGDDHM